MSSVSALILAKNEEQNIEDCIKSVSFADEVGVIDDFSTDKTAEIAARLGARAVTVAALAEAFASLWQAAERLRRRAS